MAKWSLIPSKHGPIHYTAEQANANGWGSIIGNLGFAIGDFAFSAYGVIQAEQWMHPTQDIKLQLGYITLGIGLAYIDMKQIRHGNLRLSPYYPTIRRIRQDKSIQGNMAEEIVEIAVANRQRLASDLAILLAWIYDIGSNIYGLNAFWVAIAPVVNGVHAGDALLKAFIGLIFILGVAFLITYEANMGEGAGFHFREHAKMLTIQEANTFPGPTPSKPKP